MKKNLLTLSVLALSLSSNAQIITYVGDKSSVYVAKDALVYSGGGVKVVGSGVVDNSGNIMVVGDGSSKFETVVTNGTNKTNGGNFILRMTGSSIQDFRYGQLYIKGLDQANITGIVDKEYRDEKHGTYQQIALPFYDKSLSALGTELGRSFEDKRRSQKELLVWDNKTVRFDLLTTSGSATTATAARPGGRASTAYFAMGSKGFDASVAKKTLKGVPYADSNVTETLKGAGDGIDFGLGGSTRNNHGEPYNTYLQDAFSASSGLWTGNYGKNIYQFGNPFLTNLDLSQLKTLFPDLQGVRVAPIGVTTTGKGATFSQNFRYITYAGLSGPSGGKPVGDINNAIIRPMQTFVVKLSGGSTTPLDFSLLRRFAYTAATKPFSNVTSSKRGVSVASSVKQLAVIAQNSKGEEIGRTYYVVYAGGVTGQPKTATTQVTASGNAVIGTFEENKNGGIDQSLQSTYWLYINEANEKDFKGKDILLALYSEDVKSLKFKIHENAQPLRDGQSVLTSGESFYINIGDNKPVQITNGKEIPVTVSESAAFSLYYGVPTTLAVVDEKIEKPSETFLAYDTAVSAYRLVFDKLWKSAKVQVFDMTGKLILSQDNAKTSTDFVIHLPQETHGAYIVTAVSETGKKFTQKIVKQ